MKTTLPLLMSLAACSADTLSTSEQQFQKHDIAADMSVAPAHVVIDQRYSDVRFIQVMAAHHADAIRMAQVAVDHAEHPEIKEAASKTIADQGAEIEELRDIRQSIEGNRSVPTEMSPHMMENTGAVTPEDLARSQPFDAAFLDAMMPHHASAIELSNVALRRTHNEAIASLARRIIDAQAEEMGQMIKWRKTWYFDLRYALPHEGE